MRHDLNLRHLKAAALIAELGSAHAAAAAAGVSQPAISQALKRVEAAFAAPLFERSGTGMRLNPEGQIVNLRVRRMFDALAQMRRRINGARRGQKAVKLENLVTMTHLRAVLAVAIPGPGQAALILIVRRQTIHAAAVAESAE